MDAITRVYPLRTGRFELSPAEFREVSRARADYGISWQRLAQHFDVSASTLRQAWLRAQSDTPTGKDG